MPGNQITNAGFIEGASNWTLTGNVGPATVDRSVYGYRGREVLVVAATGAATRIAQNNARTIAVSAGQTLEVFSHHAATGGAVSEVVVEFAAAQTFAAITHTLNVPIVSKAKEAPRLGLSKSFNFSHKRLISPTTGFARIVVRSNNAGATAPLLMMMRPYLEVVTPKTMYRCWDPGLHILPDWQRPRWPADLPHLQSQQFNVSSIPSRVSFAADRGFPVTRKLTNLPWHNLSGSIKATQEYQTILDKFFTEQPEPFWFVRPDTLQLVLARWLAGEGEPTISGLGPDKVLSFALVVSPY